jgi:uncharacterized membrane protein YkoI
MRRDKIFGPIAPALIGIAMVGGSGAALATRNDAPILNQQPGIQSQTDGEAFEVEIQIDQQGRKILIDPRTGEPIGLVLEVQAAPEIKPYTLNNAQMKAATAVKLSVTDIIAAVEQNSSGGKVLEVSFEPTASVTAYSLKTYRNGAVWEGKIDADSGAVLKAGKTVPDSKLDADDKAELSGLETASTTILQAVRIAELHARGKAIAVAIEESDPEGVVWEVVVVTGDKAYRVFIDPATGQVKSS